MTNPILEYCPRCDSTMHADHGCAECDVYDRTGSDGFEAIDEHAHREYGRGFAKLSADEQWTLVRDHTAEPTDEPFACACPLCGFANPHTIVQAACEACGVFLLKP